MSKIKNFCISIWNVISSKTFLLCVLICCSFSFGIYVQRELTTNNSTEYKVNCIREFVEHPSHFKLDTLYRKANDTLYIDTIKINYIKR